MMGRRRRRPFIALVAVTVALISVWIAHGYWTTSGSGSGTAAVDAPQPVDVVALTGGDTPTALLQPGGPAAEVVLRLDNPNAYSVTVVSVTGAGPVTADADHPGCVVTGVSFADQTGLAIPAAPGQSLVRLPGGASMDVTSDSGCEGATFSIPVTLTVRR